MNRFSYCMAFVSAFSPGLFHGILSGKLNEAKDQHYEHGLAKTKVCASVLPFSEGSSSSALEIVYEAASRAGYCLQNDTVGPIVNISLKGGAPENRKQASIGGIIIPTGRMHIESYRAFSQSRSSSFLKVTPAMLVFIAALAVASDRSCKRIVGLAINDDEQQHRRLLAYLRRYGGTPKYVVDDSLLRLPARVVYGGFGTVVEGNVETMWERGYGMLKRQYGLNNGISSPPESQQQS